MRRTCHTNCPLGALWEQAAAIAARMQAQGLGQEPVLLIAESQRCFVLGFYACLLAGKDCRAQRAAAPRRAARASDAAGGRRRGPLRAGRLRGRAGGRLGRRPDGRLRPGRLGGPGRR
ncbi:hypothetical protein LP419_13020 [Massilia sp. H-1]|nr:hypothetical protein LP419_13020 [Massilia sp. H-1]